MRKTGLTLTEEQYQWLEERRRDRDARQEQRVGRSEIAREALALGMAMWDVLDEEADWDLPDDDTRAYRGWGVDAARTKVRIEDGECRLVCDD